MSTIQANTLSTHIGDFFVWVSSYKKGIVGEKGEQLLEISLVEETLVQMARNSK